jgi:hypothetical protein
MSYLGQSSLARIPQFIKEDAPGFVDFLSAYYEWLSNNHQELKTTLDVDQTTENFLTNFVNQYLFVLPPEIVADKRSFIKHAREFYGSKGTEESVKLLFRTVYGESASISYPSNQLFNSSDSSWLKRTSIKVTCDNPLIVNSAGYSVTNASGAIARIESVVSYYSGLHLIYEIFISGITGTFLYGETVLVNGYTSTVLSAITSVTMSTTGQYYRKGDSGLVSGGDGVGLAVEVEEVESGKIDSITILDPGSFYAVGDMITTVPPSAFEARVTDITSYVPGVSLQGQIASVQIFRSQSLFKERPTLSCASQTGGGSGAVLIANGTNIGKIKTVDIKSFGSDYNTITPIVQFTQSLPTYVGDEIAIGTGSIGTLCLYSGRFLSTNGMTSDKTAILQNDREYMPYSYVIRSGHALSNYKSYLKDILHPAGMALFGELAIEELASIGINIGTINELDERGGYLYRGILNFLISATSSIDIPVVGGRDSIIMIEKSPDIPFNVPRYKVEDWKFNFYTRSIKDFASDTIRSWSSDVSVNSEPLRSSRIHYLPDAEHYRLDGSLNVIYPRF